MEMHESSSLGHLTMAALSSSPPSTSDAANMGMGISMTTFSTSTNVTLFVANWRTDTPAKYFGTLIFLFAITLLNRFLGAWRSQLGHKWAEQASIARVDQMRRRMAKRWNQHRQSLRDYRNNEPVPNSANVCLSQPEGEKSAWQPLRPSTEESKDTESEILEEELAMEKRLAGTLTPGWTALFGGRWRAGNPWRFKIDFPRALLEALRALIGYILMLAVMSFNIGFLLAVIFGIIVGELLLGRFMSGTGWEEGGCHDG